MATNMWLVGWIIDLEISQQEVDFLQWKEFCNSTETDISAIYWYWLIVSMVLERGQTRLKRLLVP